MIDEANALAEKGDYDGALRLLRRTRDFGPSRELEIEVDERMSTLVEEWSSSPSATPRTPEEPGPPGEDRARDRATER